MRVPRFDPRSGMSRLTTITVSQQSAEQRRGRAGRLEPGLCVRLWSEAEQRILIPRTAPEILDADLTSLALELARWGIPDPQELLWLDPPPSGAMTQARQLLQSLGAFDSQGRITPHGQAMADLPMHPRLAHMVLKGKTLGMGALACDLAAALSERDVFKGSVAREHADLRTRFDRLYAAPRGQKDKGSSDTGILQRIRQASLAWQHALHIATATSLPKQQIDRLGVLLALAYPDRIARRQADETRRYRLSNGRSAKFHHPDPLEHEEWLVIADLNGAPATAIIYLAAPITREDLITYCGDLMQSTESVTWNESDQTVLACRQRRLGELILEESRLPNPDPDLVLTALLEGLRNKGLSCLSVDSKSQKLAGTDPVSSPRPGNRVGLAGCLGRLSSFTHLSSGWVPISPRSPVSISSNGSIWPGRFRRSSVLNNVVRSTRSRPRISPCRQVPTFPWTINRERFRCWLFVFRNCSV